MHNRDMKWKTKEGKVLKIRDISSDHLVNILHHIENNVGIFNSRWGKESIDNWIHNIEQEIRLRKLNRLGNSEEDEELF